MCEEVILTDSRLHYLWIIWLIQLIRWIHLTIMHTSRMRTIHCSCHWRGGVCSEGCACQGSVYPSMQWDRHPICRQNSWHTLVKRLPFCNYIADGNYKTRKVETQIQPKLDSFYLFSNTYHLSCLAHMSGNCLFEHIKGLSWPGGAVKGPFTPLFIRCNALHELISE